jgi:hypothetical protein
MILYPTQLFAMVREGRMTLQIPELYIGPLPDEPRIEVDDGHLTRSPSGGFLFFSRMGYEFYHDQLRDHFQNTGRGTWEDFERAAEEHFVSIVRELDRKIDSHRRAIARLEARRRVI